MKVCCHDDRHVEMKRCFLAVSSLESDPHIFSRRTLEVDWRRELASAGSTDRGRRRPRTALLLLQWWGSPASTLDQSQRRTLRRDHTPQKFCQSGGATLDLNNYVPFLAPKIIDHYRIRGSYVIYSHRLCESFLKKDSFWHIAQWGKMTPFWKNLLIYWWKKSSSWCNPPSVIPYTTIIRFRFVKLVHPLRVLKPLRLLER